MSEKAVDVGAIRGDWNYHARYVTNAIEQTLKRTQKLWKALKASAADGEVSMDGDLMDDFIEACQQTRSLTDDVILLRENKPVPSARKRAGKPKKGARK